MYKGKKEPTDGKVSHTFCCFLWTVSCRMAHENGYIITAMDWRGMSIFDLPMVVKVLLSKPHLFQAVRDNLIQAYANKFALQHFSQNSLLSMEWLSFRLEADSTTNPIPTFQGRPPVFVFYGISLGGILGAGYMALSGPTGLIARGILNGGGTPFALIMTRSLDFTIFDFLLLLNFYNNRHVRIVMSLLQMAWDSVEGSGVLAPPITEPFPPTLIQAGLGDPIVPSMAAESLARAFHAAILSKNPIQPYGISISVNGTSTVVIAELLYEKEYQSFPTNNVYAKRNDVHDCLPQDEQMIAQIAEYINTGRLVDPCIADGCRRASAHCLLPRFPL